MHIYYNYAFSFYIFKNYLPEYSFPSLCNLDLTLQLSKSPFSLLTCLSFSDALNLIGGDFRGGLVGDLSVITLLGDDLVGLTVAVAAIYTIFFLAYKNHKISIKQIIIKFYFQIIFICQIYILNQIVDLNYTEKKLLPVT